MDLLTPREWITGPWSVVKPLTKSKIDAGGLGNQILVSAAE
jgi:hypothetical protein